MYPNVRVIATPNSKPLLDPLFTNVTYLEPAQVSEVEVINGSNVNVKATHGLVLRPPWQRLENRYLVSSPQGQSTLYYEPYCVYDQNSLGKECAVKKFLPKFTLVSGQEDAV
ncbi:hypothetical protein LINPERHAP2_LOCUS20098 [Linum perenne]